MTMAKTVMLRGKPVGAVAAGPLAGLGPNWLEMNGQVVLRAAYPALYNLLLTAYNTGGETGLQFRLPNTVGCVPVGYDNYGTAAGAANRNTLAGTQNTLNGRGGSATHTLTISQIPNHTHATNESPHNHTISAAVGHQHSAAGHARYAGVYVYAKAGPTARALMSGVYNNTGGAHAFTDIPLSVAGYSIGASGSGGAHENEQPYQTMRLFIKAR